MLKLANNKFTIAFPDRVHCNSRENKESLSFLVASAEGHFVKVIFAKGVAGTFRHTLQGTDKIWEFFDAVHLFAKVIGIKEVL